MKYYFMSLAILLTGAVLGLLSELDERLWTPAVVILCVGGISQVVGHLCRWGYKEDDEYEECDEYEGYDEDDEAHRR